MIRSAYRRSSNCAGKIKCSCWECSVLLCFSPHLYLGLLAMVVVKRSTQNSEPGKRRRCCGPTPHCCAHGTEPWEDQQHYLAEQTDRPCCSKMRGFLKGFLCSNTRPGSSTGTTKINTKRQFLQVASTSVEGGAFNLNMLF